MNNMVEMEERLLSYFRGLNNVGQEKVIEQAEIISKIPDFKKDCSQLKAAHKRTDIDDSDSDANDDLDIMKEENF